MSGPTAAAGSVAYEAARRRVALAPRPWRGVVEVGGADRVEFLQGLLSNDVDGLVPGAGCRALLLDVKGHVVADLDLWACEEAIVIASDSSALETALPTLQRYVLASSVSFEDRGERVSVIGVVGPRADALVADAGLEIPVPAPGSHTRATVDGVELRVARPHGWYPGLELHVTAEAREAVETTLRGVAGEALLEIDRDISEVLRIERGIPRFGAEITGDEFPQEVGLDAAISYEKGCYLGQETVARIHYRGQVNRLLCGLRCEGEVAVAAALVHAGRSAGRITSVAESPSFGVIGLGYIRRDQAEPGSTVDVVEDGTRVGSATVVALPFED